MFCENKNYISCCQHLSFPWQSNMYDCDIQILVCQMFCIHSILVLNSREIKVIMSSNMALFFYFSGLNCYLRNLRLQISGFPQNTIIEFLGFVNVGMLITFAVYNTWDEQAFRKSRHLGFFLPDMFFEELNHAPRLFTPCDTYKHIACRTGYCATVYDTRDARAFEKIENQLVFAFFNPSCLTDRLASTGISYAWGGVRALFQLPDNYVFSKS